MGISGGEEGARNGPSLMPGGPKAAFDLLEPILVKCAAQVGASYLCDVELLLLVFGYVHVFVFDAFTVSIYMCMYDSTLTM